MVYPSSPGKMYVIKQSLSSSFNAFRSLMHWSKRDDTALIQLLDQLYQDIL